MNHFHSRQRGFTIIELMLSMSFVSMLFLGVALVTIQVGNTYNRGLTMKAVNQAGRNVSDALRRDIAAAEHAQVLFIPQTTAGARDLNRLCLGNYTYVWNYGRAIYNRDAVNYAGSAEPIILARINDAGGTYCKATGGAFPIVVTQANSNPVLKNESLQLALHSFRFSPVVIDEASDQAAFSVAFTVGTNDQASILTNNQQCRPPDDASSNLEFCAINNFEMIVRAGGAL